MQLAPVANGLLKLDEMYVFPVHRKASCHQDTERRRNPGLEHRQKVQLSAMPENAVIHAHKLLPGYIDRLKKKKKKNR